MGKICRKIQKNRYQIYNRETAQTPLSVRGAGKSSGMRNGIGISALKTPSRPHVSGVSGKLSMRSAKI